MRKRTLGGLAAIAAALTLILAPAASAATEFGTSCTGNRAEMGTVYSVIQLSQNGVPTGAPSSGVITRWKSRIVPVPIPIIQQLKVFRPTADPAQFQVVGESAPSGLTSGENTFATRIPVQAGDRIGLVGTGEFGALFCSETPEAANPGNGIGIFLGNPSTGSTAALAESASESLVPVMAAIEPDVDGDGYGDETQDLCPQSAAFQVACPTVALEAVSIAGNGRVTVFVAASSTAPVVVSGIVKLGKGKAKLKSQPRTVAPGKIVRFSLKYPTALKTALQDLPSNRKLTLKLTASATNVAGQISTDRTKLRLKGEG